MKNIKMTKVDYSLLPTLMEKIHSEYIKTYPRNTMTTTSRKYKNNLIF